MAPLAAKTTVSGGAVIAATCVAAVRYVSCTGEGQAVVDCPLFSALVFPHPQHPQQPLGPEGRFNDPRRGDFLLIRRKVKEGWKVSSGVQTLQSTTRATTRQGSQKHTEVKGQARRWQGYGEVARMPTPAAPAASVAKYFPVAGTSSFVAVFQFKCFNGCAVRLFNFVKFG